MRRLAFTAVIMVSAGCAGDPGADQGLPTCNARPVDPGGYESVRTEKIEASDHAGHVYEYRGPDGQQVTFFYGVSTDAGQGLPSQGRLPLASVGGGQLTGSGAQWAFRWNDQFPCDPMTVVGNGYTRKTFELLLGLAHVTPPEEEEGEGGGKGGIAEGVPGESEEEEIAEGLPQPGGPVSEFIAVFDSAKDPNDLEEIQAELLEEAPRNIAVSPASCWKGLPQAMGIGRSHYVASVVAQTGNEIDFVIERVDRQPIFYGQLRARCVD